MRSQEHNITSRYRETSARAGGTATILDVPADTAALASLRRDVTAELGRDLDAEQLSLYLVAVTEAVTNAIEAHHANGVDAEITVTIDRSGRQVVVEDRGGATPTQLASDGDRVVPGPEASRGRGLLIMGSICPDLRIVDTPNGVRVELPWPG